jgi:hypothetical protein
MAALLLPLDANLDKPKKLLDQVRDVLRLKHYSYRTEPRKRLRLTRLLSYRRNDVLCLCFAFSQG